MDWGWYFRVCKTHICRHESMKFSHGWHISSSELKRSACGGNVPGACASFGRQWGAHCWNSWFKITELDVLLMSVKWSKTMYGSPGKCCSGIVHHSLHPKVTSSIPGQGKCPGCHFSPRQTRGNEWVFLFHIQCFSLSPFPFLSIKKYQ